MLYREKVGTYVLPHFNPSPSIHLHGNVRCCGDRARLHDGTQKTRREKGGHRRREHRGGGSDRVCCYVSYILVLSLLRRLRGCSGRCVSRRRSADAWARVDRIESRRGGIRVVDLRRAVYRCQARASSLKCIIRERTVYRHRRHGEEEQGERPSAQHGGKEEALCSSLGEDVRAGVRM